jgi:hypothetical protein
MVIDHHPIQRNMKSFPRTAFILLTHRQRSWSVVDSYILTRQQAKCKAETFRQQTCLADDVLVKMKGCEGMILYFFE